MLWLRLRRRQQFLTQAQLAARTGVAQSAISDYELGLRPQPGHLRTLAAFFGIAEDQAHTLIAEVPAALDFEARHTQVEAEFGGESVSRVAAATEVPDPPSLTDLIRKREGV